MRKYATYFERWSKWSFTPDENEILAREDPPETSRHLQDWLHHTSGANFHQLYHWDKSRYIIGLASTNDVKSEVTLLFVLKGYQAYAKTRERGVINGFSSRSYSKCFVLIEVKSVQFAWRINSERGFLYVSWKTGQPIPLNQDSNYEKLYWPLKDVATLHASSVTTVYRVLCWPY